MTALRKNVLCLMLFIGLSMVFTSVQGLHLTADNIQYHATFIDSSVSIVDRAINVVAGSSNHEKLLEVPIGDIDLHASVIITVGLNTTLPNTAGVDSDLTVGISDGSNINKWALLDKNNFGSLPPCIIWSNEGSSDDKRIVSTATVSASAKFTFVPFYKYGTCETAQEGGYINTGRFNAQLDLTKPLSLGLYRHNSGEQYSFYYILVEVVNN